MAEEEIITQEPETDQEMPQQEGPGPSPVLSPENRKKLADVLLKMEAEKASAEEMKLLTSAFIKKYGQNQQAAPTTIPRLDYRAPMQQPQPIEGTTPAAQTADRLDISQDPNAVSRRQRYADYRKQAIADIESDKWRNKIFEGERPALTDYPDMPLQAFQKVNPKAVDEYLATKDLDPANKYWLRNQILNYGKFRQSQFYVEERARKKIEALPAEDRGNEMAVNAAYQEAAQDYHKHQTEAIANRLNNVGIDDMPLRSSAPFHDQITGANKALMGTINFAGDLGQQVSSILEIAHVPGLSDLGYKLKTTADNLKARNEIPQTGEAGNLLAGEVLPMALDMTALSRLSAGVGRPLYQSLAKARATGTLGKFAEGALGGVAISPVNSYIISHQYYNDLVKNGEEPSKAAAKADQLLSKNLMTDMVILPLQMGLLHMPAGNAAKKAVTLLAEGGVAGTHFTLQDINLKSTENPAFRIMDYLKNNEWVSPMVTGAALGMIQKAGVNALENWSVNSETRNMFSYGRKYGADVKNRLPSNESIAGDVLSAFEMKDTPKRAEEIKDLITSMKESGLYRPDEEERVHQIIDDVAAVKNQVPKFGSTQQRMAIFNELLEIRSMEKDLPAAGNKASQKYLETKIKERQDRIQRIMDGSEPLYFINGNETNKVQLLRALEENPELLTSKGVRIDVRNDPATINKIKELKTQQDAIQKQSATEADVRPTSGDSEKVGRRDESEGAIDQETAGEEEGESLLNETPGADKVAEEIKSGKITDDHLLNVIQSSINETQESLQRLREGNTEQAGSAEVNGKPGQRSTEEGAASVVPETGEGPAPGDQDTGTEPLPADTGATDEARVREAESRMGPDLQKAADYTKEFPDENQRTEKAGAPDLFLREFIDEDVKPAMKEVGGSIRDFWDTLVRAFSPRRGVPERALTHIMRALGDRNHMMTLMDAGFKSIEKMFDRMPDAERIAFIDRLKRGQQQPTKELQEVDKLIRKLDKELYNEITKYKPDLSWKEDHFRVLWKVIPGSKSTAKEKIWSLLARRPFQGSQGFMRRATLADISEGIAMGGVPQSTNPITMFKIAYADAMKYITAQRMFEALKKDGFVKFVRPGQEKPEGYVPLNDNLTKRFFKVPGAATLQTADNTPYKPGSGIPPGHAYYEGNFYKVEGRPSVGPVNAGEYYVQEGAARLLNNHLSRDYIREARFGRGLMNIKNAFTAVELGLSAYHATAEGFEAISSQVGTGLRKLFNLKDYKGAVSDILTAPAAPYMTARAGRQAIKFATSDAFRNSPEGKKFLSKFPDAAQYVDDFFRGGGLMKQSEDLRSKTVKVWKEQTGKDNYIGAMLRAIPAINETIVSPLFNTFIPRLKVGMFFKEFPVALQENAERLAKGQVTREQLARKTIDFIDDRLGEMNFDNLFWNRTFKTAQQFFLRSVTWKLGNIRAMVGAVPEQFANFAAKAKDGSPVRMEPKVAWLLGLTTLQVALATIIQHMLANKPLESGKDIVAPQINENDPNERVVLPTYYKDFLHFYHSPTGYVTTSMAGQLSRTYDLWNNKDFYGYEIRDPYASKLEQLGQSLLYVAPKPFSVSSAIAMNEKGEPFAKQFMSFMGLTKAPGWLTHSDIENKIFSLYGLRNAGTKPHAQEEASQTKAEIRRLYKAGEQDEAKEKLSSAVDKGLIRPSQIKSLLKQAKGSGNASQYMFTRLPYEDKKYLYDQMDNEEKKMYDPKGKLAKQIEEAEKAIKDKE